MSNAVVWGMVESGLTAVPSTAFNTFDAAGNGTAFVDTRGNLWMMGYNEHGKMGIGSTNSVAVSPRLVLSNVADVQLGFFFSMALDYSGNVFVWGWNQYGQIGVGNAQTQYVSSPSQVRLNRVVRLRRFRDQGKS